MSCDEARGVFAASVAARQASDAATARASAHVASCPVCLARLEDLAKAILALPDAALPCAECRERVGAAAAAGLMPLASAHARPADPDYDPLTRQHLAGCAECSDVAAQLLPALAGLADGSLAAPPSVPHFDTAFLRAAPPPPGTAPLRETPPTGQARPVWAAGTRAALLVLALGIVGIAFPALWRAASRVPTAPLAAPAAVEAPAVPLAPTQVTRAAAAGGSTGGGLVLSGTTPALAHAGAGATDGPPVRPGQGAPAAKRSLAAATRRPGPRALITPTVVFEPTATSAPTEAPTEEDDHGRPGDEPTPGALEPRCSLPGDLTSGSLVQPCDRFPTRGAYDVFPFQVARRSRWRISLCGQTDVDTLLAIYPAGEFKAYAPCDGVVAYDDDSCGTQSALEVDLEPGGYILMVSDKSGDAPGAYRLQVAAEPGAEGSLCPAERP